MKDQTVSTVAPLVSVIMPAHNSARYIARAILSVREQTLPNWELWVVDDASIDQTADIVADIMQEEPRIKLLKNAVNQGPAECRNLGIRNSTGFFVAFLDSDDIWYPEKLARQIALIEQEKVDLVYCAYRYIDEFDQCSRSFFHVPPKTGLRQMLIQNVIGCSTVLIKRELADQFPFQTQFHFEDYVLWLSMLQAGKQFCGITDVLVDYRLHRKSRGSNKWRCAGHRWHVYRAFLHFSIPKSLWYQTLYAFSGLAKYLKNRKQRKRYFQNGKSTC